MPILYVSSSHTHIYPLASTLYFYFNKHTMVLRKKRNFKDLALPSGKEEAVTAESAIPTDAVGLGSVGLDTAGGATFLYEKQGYTNAAVTSLEIGVEFRLDLRSEDLQHLKEMGSGASGTVNQVLHMPTKTIMAMKVRKINSTLVHSSQKS